jgi:hypothetical protein
MSDLTCRQCGARVHEGKTCADVLFELICGERADERACLEAAARYALQHPGTHSQECLELARGYLEPEHRTTEAPQPPPISVGVAASSASGDDELGACAFRGFARRILRRLGRQALYRLH